MRFVQRNHADCRAPSGGLRRRLAGLVLLLTCALMLAAPEASAQAAADLPGSSAESQAADLERLSPEERADLLSRLSDEQVRDLLLGHLGAQARAPAEEAVLMEDINENLHRFRQGLAARFERLDALSAVPGFVYRQLSEGRGPYQPLIVLAAFLAIALLGAGVERGYRWLARGPYAALAAAAGSDPLRRLGCLTVRFGLDLIGLLLFAATILAAFFLLYQGHAPSRLTVMTLLGAVLIVRAVAILSRFVFAPRAGNLRIAPFDDDAALRIHRWILLFAVVATFGLFVCELMLRLGLPETDHELMRTLVGGILVVVAVATALDLRLPVARALQARLSGTQSWSRFGRALASVWHAAFIAYVVFLFVLSLYTGIVGARVGASPGILSVLILLAVPFADFVLCAVLDRALGNTQAGEGARPGSAIPVLKRAARILLVILAVLLIGRVWGVSLFDLGRQGMGEELMRAVIDIALIILVAYVLWGVIKAAVARYLPSGTQGENDARGDEGGGASASRVETVLPLVMRFVQITLVVIVTLILLSSLGVEIGPLLAGAGVVGLAVGFGAQTLVRDIVSGLFFLMDDAFRKGEYVDIGSVKGTVEKINLRSLVLRHHLGPLHTVPFGEIQHLTNYSRDWVIMKLEFRVPTDTDINKVKKIFKTIGVEMLQDPELGKDFLEPFKSQGVKAIEDSAMILRGKFMSQPGRQFVLRKELYNRVQKAFQEHGIPFAHRKVTVELPPDVRLEETDRRKLAEAAGAAALAAERETGGEPRERKAGSGA